MALAFILSVCFFLLGHGLKAVSEVYTNFTKNG